VKILHAISSVDFRHTSGLGQSVLDLHMAMLSSGADSQLWCAAGTGPGVHVSPMPLENPFFYSPSHRRLFDHAVRRADVVHLHGLYTHINWCVGDAVRKHGRPLVLHPQGTLAPWYLQRRRWAKACVHRLFESRNFRTARLWRATSRNEAGHIRNAHPGAEVIVVPNGLPLETSLWDVGPDKARFPGADPGRRWLLHLCRLSPVKGTDLLIHAWRRLAPLYPEWQLVLAGPDTEGIGRMFDLGSQSSSSPMVHLGVVSGVHKWALLRSSDLCVFPSRAEGFPLSVLEALAAERPVLLGREANIPEAVEAGAAWDAGSTLEDLITSLRRALATGPEELRAMGSAGRRLVLDHFTIQETARSLLAASESLLTR
jgi:glycosyltransferase involved in cell wall biosynthesis